MLQMQADNDMGCAGDAASLETASSLTAKKLVTW